MALINTLRKRMGKIVVGFVAFSMFAFILTDLFQSNSTIFGGADRTLAEVAGKDISYESFQERVDQLSYTFALNNGREPLANEMTTIREQAWNALIMDYAYGKQFDELGVKVTDAEVVDMVQGNNIDPQIKQFFTDPNTGTFSRENVQAFLQQLNNAPLQQRASWLSFEERMRPNRKIQKYTNLITKSDFVTTAEAESKYKAQNSNMTVDYFYVPFFSASDSLFKVSESEMKDYLSENSDDYQREESRSLKYVVFPVVPSSEDTAFTVTEINDLANGLEEATKDSIYANINSDGANPFRSINDPGLVPVALQGAEVGTVTEPQLINSYYTVHKLSAITEGDEAFVKARHILIEMDGNSDAAKAAAKQKANDIVRKLRRGADFADLAAINSADKSNANNGGDLGWFGENGNFVQPFKDAVFNHRGTGLIPTPVETSFGYHIIRIDEPKTNTVYKIATIEKELYVSDATINENYREADLLIANSADADSFTANAEAQGLTIRTASNVTNNDRGIGVLQEARNIVMWLYNEASVGDISEVFEMDDQYVVAVMTGKQIKGTAKLAQVENEIKTKILNQKKTEYIKEKLASMSADDFESMKSAYGDEARTGTADITLSSNSFPNIGFAPDAIGVAFSLEEGERTQPFAVTNGVLMLNAVTKSMAEDQEDYSAYKPLVANERRQRNAVIANFPLSFYPIFVPQSVDNTVKEFADIEDKRYRFF